MPLSGPQGRVGERALRGLVVASGGLSAEISARIMENIFYELDLPVERLCSAEVPMPYSKHMEEAAVPQPEGIVSTVKRMVQ